MSDIITGMRQVIQDLVAPDLKAQTVRLDSLEKRIDLQHEATMKTIDAFRAEMRAEFVSLRAHTQIEAMRQLAPLSERLAIVEART